MATPTYDLLESVTLATAASSITFASIDQSFGDLVLVVNGATTISNDDARINFNGDTGSNYHYVSAIGTGSSAVGSASTNNRIELQGGWSTSFDNLVKIEIADYSATDKHKSVLTRGNNVTSSRVAMQAARWANTAAITSIAVAVPTRQFAVGSTFNLYGVAK